MRHALTDPLGFAFPNFDEAGSYYPEEQGRPIDASGDLPRAGSFEDAPELGALLAAEDDSAQCLAERAVQVAFANALPEGFDCQLEQLRSGVEARSTVHEILRRIVTSEVFAVAEP